MNDLASLSKKIPADKYLGISPSNLFNRADLSEALRRKTLWISLCEKITL